MEPWRWGLREVRVPQAKDSVQGGSTRGHIQEAEKAGVCARVQERSCGGKKEVVRRDVTLAEFCRQNSGHPEVRALTPYFFFSKIAVKYTQHEMYQGNHLQVHSSGH